MKLPPRLALVLFSSTAALASAVGCSNDDPGTTDSADGAGGEAGGCDRPGESWCTGTASGLTCPEDGSAAFGFTCASGDECKDGECVGQCEPGAVDCAGEFTRRVCSPDGRSWVVEACQAGFVCEDGSCTPGGGKVCIPNSTECVDEKTQRTCKEDGSGWDELDCPGKTACSDDACRGTVCAVGATKCDPSADDALASMFEGSHDPNVSVVYTCTDGEHWEATPCSLDEDALEVCMYSGVDPQAVARYQKDVSAWFISFAFAMDNGQPVPPTPLPPAIPANAKASCEPLGCLQDAMYEGPLAMFEGSTRLCGKDSEDEQYWKSFRECSGLIPYAPAVETVVQCKGLSECSWNDPSAGCRAVECHDGESRCSPSNESQLEYCHNGYWQYDSMCGGDPAGVCTGSGKYPNREASCPAIAAAD